MKKDRNRFMSIVLVIALLFGMIPGVCLNGMTVYATEAEEIVASGTSGGITWTLTKDETVDDWDLTTSDPYKLTITGSGAMSFSSIPWKDYYASITTLSIEEGITEICANAFKTCYYLETVELPDSVTTIGEMAFYNCKKLESFKAGSGLKMIGESAFTSCKVLADVELNVGLESISMKAFSDCDALTNLVIPDTVETIGELAFSSGGLTDIEIPKGVTSMSGALAKAQKLETIRVAEENTKFQVIDNVLYEMLDGKPYAVTAYPIKKEGTTYTIEEGTQFVDKYAFYYVTNLEEVIMGEDLTAIGDYAFDHTSLNKVTLPQNMTTIGSYAFQSTKIEEINIPDSVTFVGDYAFINCTNLKSVTMGKGIKEWTLLMYGAFAIENVQISEENEAFISVDNVIYSKDQKTLYYYATAKQDTTYKVLYKTEHIERFAFLSVVNLEELYLPEGLKTIGNKGINMNGKLKSIYFKGNAPTLSSSTSISQNLSTLLLYTIEGTTGWDTSYWTNYIYATWDPANLTQDSGIIDRVTWTYKGENGSITFVGEGDIPDFAEGKTPWNVYMPKIQTIEAEGVTAFGDYAFYNAEKLVRIEADTNLKRIGDYAFAEAGKLVYADVDSVTTIENSAFENAVLMESDFWTIDLNLLGARAFKNCAKLKNITLGTALPALEEEVFAGCTSLSYVVIPESVTQIKDEALKGCTFLYSINIPEAVTTIGSKALAENTGLEKVYFYGGVPETVSENSFENSNENLVVCYRSGNADWETIGATFMGIPLQKLDRFYTERRDNYSFANMAGSFGYEAGYKIPRQRYVDVMKNISIGTYFYLTSGEWGGSCFGMTSSAIDFYENAQLDVKQYDANAVHLFDLSAPKDKNAEVTKMIESYQISQYMIAGSHMGNEEGDYWDLIQKVEEFERAGGIPYFDD